MTEKKSSVLPRIEILVMAVFFLGFSFWSISRCNATKERYRQQAILEEQAAQEMEKVNAAIEKKDSIAPEPAPKFSGSGGRYTPLYVTIEGLNMRSEPSLNSEVILSLNLYEEVTFMNEVTPFRDSINFSGEMVYEPWIKIRHRKGRVGWVYGAGVHYYKIRR